MRKKLATVMRRMANRLDPADAKPMFMPTQTTGTGNIRVLNFTEYT